MRRMAVRRSALAIIAALLGDVVSTAAVAQTGNAPPQPPHAWLFGTWTGGLFPSPSGLSAQACLSQPVVIFSRDVVLRATLTSELYIQRVIESARTTPTGAEFRFAQALSGPTDLLGAGTAPAAQGFGCDNPDVLRVDRHTDNEIGFPGCGDFPYPLVRCPAR
jgi:hypothetical protein